MMKVLVINCGSSSVKFQLIELEGDSKKVLSRGVVHGGESFLDSTLVTEDMIRSIQEYSDLSSLHKPANLTGIRPVQRLLPGIPHVAIFDTAFHQTMPKYAYVYAIDYSYYQRFRIRKYGFHGTSHQFVATRAAKFLGIPFERISLVTCHHGNSSSITAVRKGKPVDTSMGLTPLKCVHMGNRSG